MKKLILALFCVVLATSVFVAATGKRKPKSADTAAAAGSGSDASAAQAEGNEKTAKPRGAKKMKKDGGPVRDDAKIEAAVNAKIAEMESIKDAGIKVESKNGEVTLTGTVKNNAQKGVATKAAKHVDGVRTVNNQITVEKGAKKSAVNKKSGKSKSEKKTKS